ncbi:MAG: hypothetical protein DMG15_25235 [Acidobacteria bacterium]|nr:MAG: hypothetical protein DMG15_25235 [Acidobacteriota bacterium]
MTMQQDPSASPTPDIGHPDTAFDQNKSLGIRNDIDFGAESSRPTSSLSALLFQRRSAAKPKTAEFPPNGGNADVGKDRGPCCCIVYADALRIVRPNDILIWIAFVRAFPGPASKFRVGRSLTRMFRPMFPNRRAWKRNWRKVPHLIGKRQPGLK